MTIVSRDSEADGPKASVTGVSSSPGSGMRVWNPSWMPTGAAMYRVKNGLPRWVTWCATHQKPQTYCSVSRVADSFPSTR